MLYRVRTKILVYGQCNWKLKSSFASHIFSATKQGHAEVFSKTLDISWVPYKLKIAKKRSKYLLVGYWENRIKKEKNQHLQWGFLGNSHQLWRGLAGVHTRRERDSYAERTLYGILIRQWQELWRRRGRGRCWFWGSKLSPRRVGLPASTLRLGLHADPNSAALAVRVS